MGHVSYSTAKKNGRPVLGYQGLGAGGAKGSRLRGVPQCGGECQGLQVLEEDRDGDEEGSHQDDPKSAGQRIVVVRQAKVRLPRGWVWWLVTQQGSLYGPRLSSGGSLTKKRG